MNASTVVQACVDPGDAAAWPEQGEEEVPPSPLKEFENFSPPSKKNSKIITGLNVLPR